MTYEYFNGTDIGEMSIYANTVTNGVFWPMTLLILYAILFGASSGQGARVANFYAMSGVMVGSILLLAAELISPSLIPIIFVMFFGSLAAVYLK